MSGSFDALNIASGALQAYQRALDVTGNNISNVNTQGYSRQKVNFAALQGSDGYGLHPYQLGNGVSIESVSRIRDMLLDGSMNSAQSDLGKFSSLAAALNSVQGTIPEPGDNGISAALNKFFDAWSGLSANPGDPAGKLQVQMAGQALTQRVRSTYAALQQQKDQIGSQITNTFDEIDRLSAQIGDLNKQIASKGADGEPNDLLDQRDLAIQNLSSLVNIHIAQGPNGTVSITTNGQTLVDAAGSKAITRTYDSSIQSLTSANGPISLQGGQLVGLMQAVAKVNGYQSQLDQLANTLKTETNALHKTGKTATSATGVDFFADSDPQTGAIDFDLSAEVKADPNAIASGTSGNAGDGGLALALSKLRDTSINGLGGKTISGFYTAFVGTVANDAAYAKNSEGTQAAVVQQVANQQQSVSGVNLDEEMSNMLRFQRSYQAAARALSVFDQVTNDLINALK